MEYTLITGASSGLGRELAIEISKEKNVIINGRNLDRLKETAGLCRNSCLIWNYDLSDNDNIEGSLGDLIKTEGISVSSFIHCAGYMKMQPLRVVNTSFIHDVFSVNVFAPMLITKVLSSKKVNERNLKSVVFISSNISNRGAAAFSAYGSSKAALDGLMRNLSIELAPNVRVNSVLPGGMITEMTKEIFDDTEKMEAFSKRYPLGIGTPQDVIPAVKFLISDESKWITGQQLTVDGGRTIDITER